MLSASDVEALYRSHSSYLVRLVSRDARASSEVVEDACQQAWSSVLAHRERVEPQGAFAWLTCTAVREAWRLSRRQQAHVWPVMSAGPTAAPGDVVELRERLWQLGRLPVRQQRLLWLSAAGLDYEERARHEGTSRRTVERQLLRGRRAAREQAGGAS